MGEAEAAPWLDSFRHGMAEFESEHGTQDVGAFRGDGWRVGRLAVERGLVTSEQLAECLEEQARSGEEIALAALLVRHRYLSASSLASLLNDQAPDVAVPPRYRIESSLGQGGAAVVYRARDTQLDRPVALKVMRRSGNASLKTRFEREARVVAGLTHPNVVGIYDVGEAGDRPFLVMELVEGRSLAELIAQKAPLAQLLTLLEQAALGVAAAHAKGIVHRDLKPGNILVTSKGEAKVADFGLAYVAGGDARITGEGTTLGTPLYMAPEQAAGESDRVTPRTDVYALGAILYEMVAGRAPHEADTVAELFASILTADVVPPSRRNAAVSPPLDALCLRALSRDPKQRPADAGEFAAELVLARNGGSRVRAPWRSILAGGAVVLVGIAAYAVTRPGPAAPPAEPPVQRVDPFDAGMAIFTKVEGLASQPDAASEEFEKLAASCIAALKQAPGRAAAHLAIARVHRMKAEWDPALDQLSKALQADSRLVDAVRERVIVRVEKTLADPANFGDSAKLHPKVRDAMKAAASDDLKMLRQLKDDRWAEAVERFLAGSYEKAAPELAACAASEPALWMWSGLAVQQSLVDRRRPTDAERQVLDRVIDAHSNAIAIRPRHVVARIARGMAYLEKASDRTDPIVDRAIADFSEAFRIDPRNKYAVFHRAEARGKKGEWALARDDASIAIQLDGQFREAFALRGDAALRLGQPAEAVKDLNRAFELGATDSGLAWNRARALLQAKEYAKCIAECDRLLKLDPKNPASVNDLKRQAQEAMK